MVGSILVALNNIPGVGSSWAYSYSGISNNLIGSFILQPGLSRLNTSFAYDGTNLLEAVSNIRIVYKYSGVSNVVLGSFTNPSGTSYPRGITYVTGSLYSSDSVNFIRIHSGISATINGSYNLVHVAEDLTSLNGNIYHLYSVGDNNKWIYKHDGVGSNYLGSINLTNTSDTPLGYVDGISFDTDGNLLYLTDFDTTTAIVYGIYKYDGFSNTLIGSTLIGIGSNIYLSSITYIPEQVIQGIQINQSDSLSVSDSLTKQIKVKKTLSDSSVLSDNFSLAGISSAYLIDVSENIIVEDGETIGKRLKLRKTFSDSIDVSDNYSSSQQGESVRSMTFIRVDIT